MAKRSIRQIYSNSNKSTTNNLAKKIAKAVVKEQMKPIPCDPPKEKPHMYLDDDDVLKGKKVGDKVSFMVTGKVTHNSMSEREDHTHLSQTIEVNKIKQNKGGKGAKKSSK